MKFDVKTPCYVVDAALLIKNLECLKAVSERSNCKILLAQKAFSMFYFYPLIKKYLSGTCASGLFEAKLGCEQMNDEVHVFSAAFKEDEIDEILSISSHVVFNSFSQWEKYRTKAIKTNKSLGIRINPEISTQEHAIYDPCSSGSRLGVTLANFRADLLEGISGLHFHTLCEQNSDALVKTLEVVEEKFGAYLNQMQWVNFGGGHHITREDYDIPTLINAIEKFSQKYGVQVYLEPGEAVALNAGYLVGTVIDIVHNEIDIAILDTSAACHMPDVIEMPYRPNVIGAGKMNEKAHSYRLAGMTCLSGDIIGDYSFDSPLEIGQQIVFCDMAIYTMVKNNTFNGMGLPSIAVKSCDGSVKVIKEFSYEDFKGRLS